MKIQFVKEQERFKGDVQYIDRIIIDDIKDEASFVQSKNLTIKREETLVKLMQLSTNKLKTHFNYLSYTFETDWSEYPLYVIIALPLFEGDEGYISVNFEIRYLNWIKPYTILEFIKIHEQTLKRVSDINFFQSIKEESDEQIGCFFNLNARINDLEVPVQKHFDYLILQMKESHLSSLKFLESEFGREGLSVLYNFPREIRVAYSQYLTYFTQFLLDLGIDADTSIKEDANQTLFTVTPKDKKQALETIYKALIVYLEVPSDNSDLITFGSDLAHIQWKANILHLKSQLELSRALLQAKEETIEALKIANFQLLSSLPKNQKNKIEKSGTEEILGGIATIDDIKLKGVTIRLPEIIRRLRRRFK